MIKIVTIIGARPQFIKASSISRAIANVKNVEEILVHTGQHYDSNMSDVFFDEMHIPKPKYYLGIGGNTHGQMTGRMIEKIEEVLIKEQPDWVLVYGDTNSTLAGAIAASKLNIKIAHVEAGLRSFNTNMPEEINRILTDRISSLLFCPTALAVRNLENEGAKDWSQNILLVGDVMQDGALFYKDLAVKPLEITFNDSFVLSTIHRAENTDDKDRLSNIVTALNTIALTKKVVLPLHPRTKSMLQGLSVKLSSNIKVMDPVGYLNMVWLIQHCDMVLTDSGGLQKEAFFFQKPCVTFRDETEWLELIENKFNILVGADCNMIIDAYINFEFSKDFEMDLYGKGLASDSIVKSIVANS